MNTCAKIHAFITLRATITPVALTIREVCIIDPPVLQATAATTVDKLIDSRVNTTTFTALRASKNSSIREVDGGGACSGDGT